MVNAWLDQLDPDTVTARDARHLRAITAASEALSEAVADARAVGESWAVIGAALAVTPDTARHAYEGTPVDDLAARMTAAVERHDADARAAVWLATHTPLLHKIGPYVEPDGWVDWPQLARELIGGRCGAWSGGELRLARLACSLSGQLKDLTGLHVDDISLWTLDALLYGVDVTVALAAIDYAATGQPPTAGD